MKRTLAVMAMGVLLCGCTSLQATLDGSAGDARKAIQVGLTAYRDIYQPAVLLYGKLPDCPTAVVCRDPAAFRAMQAADKAATKAINDTKTIVDGLEGDSNGKLQALQTAIQDAELLIAKSGALNLVKGN